MVSSRSGGYGQPLTVKKPYNPLNTELESKFWLSRSSLFFQSVYPVLKHFESVDFMFKLDIVVENRCPNNQLNMYGRFTELTVFQNKLLRHLQYEKVDI